ncbi:intercellular adhesion molecule 1-like isoform 2-T2 [Spheniscus humboldti]
MGDDAPLSQVSPPALPPPAPPHAGVTGSGFRSHPRSSPLPGVAMPGHGLPAWSLTGLLLALCGPPTSPFEVTLEGTSSEVGYGGTVLLNCSSSCPEATVGGLETSLSKEWVGRGPGWLSVRLRNITESLSNIFCYFSCFGERKIVTFRVLAYDLPQPDLAISNPNASCNEPVAINCSSAPSWPPGLKLRLRSSRQPLQPWAEGPVHLELMAREEDDGAEFICEAQLSVGNETRQKTSATATLRVTCQPRMDDGSCPPSQNWTEGQDETLRCSARGNPPPRLECTKDGKPFPAGVPRPVTRTHAGTYCCQATNRLDHDPDVVLPVLLGAVALVALLTGVVVYRIYYRKKKIRLYRLQQLQRRLEMQPPRSGQEDNPPQ